MLDDSNRRRQLRQPLYKGSQRERQQFIAVMALFVVVAMIIGALYLVQSTTSVSTVREIQQLREQRDRIQRENEALRAENAELYSIPNLIQRAETLGFVTAAPEDIQYLVVEGYVFDHVGPTITPIQMSPTPLVYEDNFAGWLQRQMDALQNLFEKWGQE